METSSDQSTLEILPDEILLEVCQYLLCTDVLYSFMGLNYRITRMIAQYHQHLSLRKASLEKFDYLCVNILPQIGSHLRSLVIDCCYSLLQDRLFIKYFSENMSLIFPRLERIGLILYTYDQLMATLSIIHDLNDLVEIRLYRLFAIQKLQQPVLTRTLFQANNHRLTTIFCDNHSARLSFDRTDCYLNILRLRLELQTLADLPALFDVVPNVQHLDVTIEEQEMHKGVIDASLSPLIHLTNFQLKSVTRVWRLEELTTLFNLLPSVQSLSLFLTTYEECLIQGDLILSLLPSTVQKFNYAVYFYSHTALDEDYMIVSSWPPSHPVACFFSDVYLFLHTLPWHFPTLDFLSPIGKVMSSQAINTNGYDRRVEQISFSINKIFTWERALTILSNCCRVREITINVKQENNIVKEKKSSMLCISKLSRVAHIWLRGLIPADFHYLSTILKATPNLFSLELSLAYLLRLIEDPQIGPILNQQIISLCIFENGSNPSSVTLNKNHVPIIASAFSRVRDIYVNIRHLSPSRTRTTNEDVLEGSPLENVLVLSNQENNEVIAPLSSESMLLCLLETFKGHQLIALCVDGQFVEKIKTDPEQWLRANTLLAEQPFLAVFDPELNRLMIWM